MNHPGGTFNLFSRMHVAGDLVGPHLYIPEEDYDYDSYPNGFARNHLQPHPRIRELAEEVHSFFFHYKEKETESESPPTFFFFCRRQKNMHRNC